MSFADKDTKFEGMCECGCGQTVSRYTHTDKRTGAVKGRFARFRHGHARPKPRTLDQVCEQCRKALTGIRSDKKYCTGCANDRRRVSSRKLKRVERSTVEYKKKYREWCLLKKYGMTLEDFNAMLEKQGGCAICGSDNPRWHKDWHVDHDHLTGRVRGLLCSGCNRALGYFHDDPQCLRRAALYLEGKVGGRE